MSDPEWTTEQVAELYCETILIGLEGADDEDTVRPRLVIEELAAQAGVDPETLVMPENLTVKQARENILQGRADLASRE